MWSSTNDGIYNRLTITTNLKGKALNKNSIFLLYDPALTMAQWMIEASPLSSLSKYWYCELMLIILDRASTAPLIF